MPVADKTLDVTQDPSDPISPYPQEYYDAGPEVPQVEPEDTYFPQPHTHTSPAIVQAFKALTLKAKLKMCKEIEERNNERNMKTLLNASDPVTHPEPGSETASMFTIDDEDMQRLQRPSFAALFKDVLP